MNISSHRHLLALPALIVAALACGLPSSPSTYIVVGPDPTVSVSPDDMKAAGEVIERRLNAADLNHGVDASDSQIKIYLADPGDQQAVTTLATAPGAIEFFLSDTALEPGTIVTGLGDPALTDADFDSVKAAQSVVTGAWEIQFTLTFNGGDKFGTVTQANVGKYMVVAQDGIVLSSPQILSAITGDKGIITGQFDEASAKLLAAELSGGRLPIALQVLEVNLPQ